MVGISIAHAATAAATTLKWTCTVAPQTWCENPTAHDYFASFVTNTATFDVIVQTKFIFSGTKSDVVYGSGTICGSCATPDLDLAAYNIGTTTYPLVYNVDPTHTRTFTIYSDYF